MEKSKTNKDTLKESLIEYKNIEKMISENTTNQIKDLLSEGVKKELRNIIEATGDDDMNDMSEIEPETDDKGQDDIDSETGDKELDGNEPAAENELGIEPEIVGDEEGTGMESGTDENGEDFDLDSFKTGEDEYDLTNSNIEDVIKVFKKIDNDDSIIVKKLDNGKINLSDNETGAEYVIDMNGDSDSDTVSTEGDDEIANQEMEVAKESTDEESTDETLTEDSMIEIELDGAEDNLEEKNMTQSIGTNRRAGRMTQTRQEYAPSKPTNRDGAQLIANESKRIATMYNQKIKKIEEAYEQKLADINNEIKEYKNTLNIFRDKLKENAVLNNNLAKYVKLVTENATTKDEKLAILKRFSEEANTIEAGNQLFESINSSLNSKPVPEIGVNIDKQLSVKQNINEQVIYQSNDLQKTIGLMNRMNSL